MSHKMEGDKIEIPHDEERHDTETYNILEHEKLVSSYTKSNILVNP